MSRQPTRNEIRKLAKNLVGDRVSDLLHYSAYDGCACREWPLAGTDYPHSWSMKHQRLLHDEIRALALKLETA